MCGPAPGIAKLMVSAPAEAFASSMAALKVHWSADVIWHNPLPGVLSASSSMELTIKVLAWAGFAASTPIKATITSARTKKAKVLALSTHIALRTAIPAMPLSLSLLSLCEWGGAQSKYPTPYNVAQVAYSRYGREHIPQMSEFYKF